MRRAWLCLLPLALAGCTPGGPAPAPSLPATPTPIYAPKPSATMFVHLLDVGRIDPVQMHGQPGQLVKLVLVGDHRKHDFTSPALNINIDVPPEAVEVIDVELPRAPGSYDYWSAQPGDRAAGMAGQFIVAAQ